MRFTHLQKITMEIPFPRTLEFKTFVRFYLYLFRDVISCCVVTNLNTKYFMILIVCVKTKSKTLLDQSHSTLSLNCRRYYGTILAITNVNTSKNNRILKVNAIDSFPLVSSSEENLLQQIIRPLV